jgi:hypothetical protein
MSTRPRLARLHTYHVIGVAESACNGTGSSGSGCSRSDLLGVCWSVPYLGRHMFARAARELTLDGRPRITENRRAAGWSPRQRIPSLTVDTGPIRRRWDTPPAGRVPLLPCEVSPKRAPPLPRSSLSDSSEWEIVAAAATDSCCEGSGSESTSLQLEAHRYEPREGTGGGPGDGVALQSWSQEDVQAWLQVIAPEIAPACRAHGTAAAAAAAMAAVALPL